MSDGENTFDFDSFATDASANAESSFSEPIETAQADNGGTQSPAIDPNEFTALKQELSSLRRWKEDTARAFGGQPEQQVNQFDPNRFVADLVTDPSKTLDPILDQKFEAKMQQMEWQQAEQEYDQKYPQYTPFKSAIVDQMNEAMQEAYQKENRILPVREAIEAGIQRFEAKLQSLTQAASQASAVKNMAMSLDVSGGQAPKPLDLSNMSDKEFFAAYQAQQLRGRQ